MEKRINLRVSISPCMNEWTFVWGKVDPRDPNYRRTVGSYFHYIDRQFCNFSGESRIVHLNDLDRYFGRVVLVPIIGISLSIFKIRKNNPLGENNP